MSNWVLKRNDNDATITLPQDMRWLDEFDWSPLAESNPVYTLGGATETHQGTKLSGRPITLGGKWVWHERGDFKKLQTWSGVPELKLTLTHYDGTTYRVKFCNYNKAIDCEPVNYETPEPDDAPYIMLPKN